MLNPFRRRRPDADSAGISQAVSDAATRLKEMAARHLDPPAPTIVLGPPQASASQMQVVWPQLGRRQAQ